MIEEMMLITIRGFRDSDVMGVMRILVHDGWLHNRFLLLFHLKYGKWFDRVRECTSQQSLRPLSTSKRDRVSYVAETKSRTVGFIQVAHVQNDAWIVGALVVHPKYQRKGIATKLVEKAISYVEEHKGKEIHAFLLIDQVPAIELYEKLGFKIGGFRFQKILLSHDR